MPDPSVPDASVPPPDAELLRAFLAETDAACPRCRYDLRHGVSEQCPECGQTLRLQVIVPDMPFGPWVTALLAGAVPAGFGWLFSALLTIVAIARNRGPSITPQLLVPTLLLGGLGTAQVAWLVFDRRRWSGWSPRRQWVVAFVLVVLNLAMIAWAMVVLRDA